MNMTEKHSRKIQLALTKQCHTETVAMHLQVLYT